MRRYDSNMRPTLPIAFPVISGPGTEVIKHREAASCQCLEQVHDVTQDAKLVPVPTHNAGESSALCSRCPNRLVSPTPLMSRLYSSSLTHAFDRLSTCFTYPSPRG